MGFGKMLKEKMKLRDVKQAELARALGIPKTTLCSMINRDNMKVDIEILLKICDYLDCDPEDFYQDWSKKQKNPPSAISEREILKSMIDLVDDERLITLRNFLKYLLWLENHPEEQG